MSVKAWLKGEILKRNKNSNAIAAAAAPTPTPAPAQSQTPAPQQSVTVEAGAGLQGATTNDKLDTVREPAQDEPVPSIEVRRTPVSKNDSD